MRKNTILLIITIIILTTTLGVLIYAYNSSSSQRAENTAEILKSNMEVKRSNDSLISVIKDFVKK